MGDNPAEDIELLPCPFCGQRSAKALAGIRRVICMTPGCDAEMGGSTQRDAIARWNTRAALTPTGTRK